VFDTVEAKKSAENPLFKEIVESQRKFAERAVKWTWTPTFPAAWPTTTTSGGFGGRGSSREEDLALR